MRRSGLRRDPPAARAWAGATALAAWVGLALQFKDVLPLHHGNWAQTAWALLAYFTITTNLLVAAVFTGVAVERSGFSAPRLLAGVLLAILLVGVVYWTLLYPRTPPKPGTEVANALVHAATPLLALGYWLAFARRGEVRWTDPLPWAAYPLGYLGYVLLRGAATHHYPYFFIDAGRLGYPHALLNALAITVAFCVAGLVLVAADRTPARR